jgi:hypothetical protein
MWQHAEESFSLVINRVSEQPCPFRTRGVRFVKSRKCIMDQDANFEPLALRAFRMMSSTKANDSAGTSGISLVGEDSGAGVVTSSEGSFCIVPGRGWTAPG